MNKLAIITGFLGKIGNRYMLYQDDRTLGEKLEMASRVKGVDGLELCYPADFQDPDNLKSLLNDYNFKISAINFRSRRTGKWWRGSFTSQKAHERQEVIDDLKRTMDFAADFGCSRITTCPLNDGSDTLFEIDYSRAYDHAAEAFSRVCSYNSDIRLCIEYKKSDPMACCIFGTAGETACFCLMVGADNLGVTLDTGHAFFAGERPAQSAALLAGAKKLFYVHLNDNDGRWDWDLVPGAYHLWEFVEFFYTLRKLGYDNDWYAFDVFPKEIDTVDNFQTVVKLTRKLEEITERIDSSKMEELLRERNSSKTIPYLYSLL